MLNALADPIVSIALGALILISSARLLRRVFHVLRIKDSGTLRAEYPTAVLHSRLVPTQTSHVMTGTRTLACPTMM